jgi:hypothetical protein
MSKYSGIKWKIKAYLIAKFWNPKRNSKEYWGFIKNASKRKIKK